MADEDVLVVTHPLAPASESHVAALLDILSAITSVALVTTNLSPDASIRSDHEVIEISKKGAGDSIAIAALRFVVNQIRMCRTIYMRDERIVLFFGATSYLLPIVFARVVGRRVLLEPRGDVPLTLYLQWAERIPEPAARLLAGTVGFLERLGYQTAHGIITYTPAMAEELGLDRYEYKLYSDGARYIDTERFRPVVPFEERTMTVGFLGRFEKEKGIRTLAEVAMKLPEDIGFRFIGDGPLRPWLESKLDTEIKTGNVEITGWIDHEEVPTQLNDLQLLVLFSEPTEGLPTVILESMACGTPVYATPVSGVPDVVREGETGFIVRETTPEHIADNIRDILSDGNLAEISSECVRTIETDFSFASAVRRYSNIFENKNE